MALSAKDMMQTHIVSVSADAPLADVSRLFVEEGINGAPVIDEMERLLGVVSSSDLLRAIEQEHDAPANDPTYFRDTLEFSGPDWLRAGEDFQDRLAELRVEEVMQTDVVTVTEDTPIPEVAKLIRANRIHRVLVLRDECLVGILSTFDLVELLESTS